MKYFACSDIHGFYDEWMTALKENGFDVNNPEHKIIVCGDLFDRGKQPKQIIDFILNNKDKFILIRGNHEDLMAEMIKRNYSEYYDLLNSTAFTMVDLCPEFNVHKFNLTEIAKETRIQEVLDRCIDYFETEHYVFVHGWIPVLKNGLYDKNWRKATKKRWEKARWSNPVEMFRNKVYEPNKTIVCGHWNCSALWVEVHPDKYEEYGANANNEPFITKEMIALDACTICSERVNVVILED